MALHGLLPWLSRKRFLRFRSLQYLCQCQAVSVMAIHATNHSLRDIQSWHSMPQTFLLVGNFFHRSKKIHIEVRDTPPLACIQRKG
jgi:hypothetical protein